MVRALVVSVGAASAIAVLSVTAQSHAEAQVWFDGRGSAPVVLNDGPGDSSYHGRTAFGLRFGAISMRDAGAGFMFGVERYGFVNSVPLALPGDPHSIGASVWTFPFYLALGPSAFNSSWSRLLIHFAMGPATRSFDGIDGRDIAFFGSMGVTWALFPAGKLRGESNFFFGPQAEISFISDGKDSHVGDIATVTMGARLGIGG